MDILLGQIALFPYNFAPEGWAPCDGSVLDIQQNSALFSLLGVQFGGDGQKTFALPDLAPHRTRQGAELRYFIAVVGVYPRRP